MRQLAVQGNPVCEADLKSALKLRDAHVCSPVFVSRDSAALQKVPRLNTQPWTALMAA